MVETLLVNRQIDEGKKLIMLLDEVSMPAEVAFWMNNPEEGDWQLILGRKGINRTGARKTYEQVYSLIKENGLLLDFNDVSVVDSDSNLCDLLKKYVQTGSDIVITPFLGKFIGGYRFPDSIIYRVNS